MKLSLKSKLKKPKPKSGLPLGSGALMVLLLVMFPMALVFTIMYLLVFLVPTLSVPIEHSGLVIMSFALIVVVTISVVYMYLLAKGPQATWGEYKGG